jgi:hypothetical protein
MIDAFLTALVSKESQEDGFASHLCDTAGGGARLRRLTRRLFQFSFSFCPYCFLGCFLSSTGSSSLSCLMSLPRQLG